MWQCERPGDRGRGHARAQARLYERGLCGGSEQSDAGGSRAGAVVSGEVSGVWQPIAKESISRIAREGMHPRIKRDFTGNASGNWKWEYVTATRFNPVHPQAAETTGRSAFSVREDADSQGIKGMV